MFRILPIAMILLGSVFFCQSASAQTADGVAVLAQEAPMIPGIKVIGVGLAVVGAGLGIGKIGASACESIARQPDMAAQIQTAMIIAAALIEGAAFAAILLGMFIA